MQFSLVSFLIFVGVCTAAPGETGTTKGIIDVSKLERPADATTLVGTDSYNLLPDGTTAGTKWVFAEGVLTASPDWDSVLTKEAYQDFRMHVEFNVNEVKDVKDPEANGNSGIYIQQRYELQIHNSIVFAAASTVRKNQISWFAKKQASGRPTRSCSAQLVSMATKK